MAKENVSRGQAWASEIGPVNRPKLERTPKFTMATRQPATITTVGAKYQGSLGAAAFMAPPIDYSNSGTNRVLRNRGPNCAMATPAMISRPPAISGQVNCSPRIKMPAMAATTGCT